MTASATAWMPGSPPPYPGLALFDFDGTITADDSFRHFLPYAVGWPRTIAVGILLSPVLAGYLLGLFPNWWAKQKVFSRLFAGWSRERFENVAADFSREVLPGLIKKSALERVQWHRRQNHRVILVSASLEPYLRGWCDIQGIELLGTRIEYRDEVVTGRFTGANCYGPEKVARVKELLNPEQYAVIYAYGDSSGDRELLAMAHDKHYRSFA
jgi:HAD superfamily hydrolase (TIGR01490 family)